MQALSLQDLNSIYLSALAMCGAVPPMDLLAAASSLGGGANAGSATGTSGTGTGTGASGAASTGTGASTGSGSALGVTTDLFTTLAAASVQDLLQRMQASTPSAAGTGTGTSVGAAAGISASAKGSNASAAAQQSSAGAGARSSSTNDAQQRFSPRAAPKQRVGPVPAPQAASGGRANSNSNALACSTQQTATDLRTPAANSRLGSQPQSSTANRFNAPVSKACERSL